jgi:uncharacterized membrane protein YeaQ/YmgE (transglycosylase-associated protein family)
MTVVIWVVVGVAVGLVANGAARGRIAGGTFGAVVGGVLGALAAGTIFVAISGRGVGQVDLRAALAALAGAIVLVAALRVLARGRTDLQARV